MRVLEKLATGLLEDRIIIEENRALKAQITAQAYRDKLNDLKKPGFKTKRELVEIINAMTR